MRAQRPVFLDCLFFLLVAAVSAAVAERAAIFTSPFTRNLQLVSPAMSGSDVVVLQNLVARALQLPPVPSQLYDIATAKQVAAFQQSYGISSACGSGCADAETTNLLLQKFSADHWKDPMSSPLPKPYMYKVHIPVHRDRTIEVNATLYDVNMRPLHVFTVRTHGQLDFNEFSGDGNTPSGLTTFDLNSPENDPVDYGPYPVNRAIQGLAGNAAFLMPWIRNGILMHTGEWPDWNPSKPMPNSHGCIHAHPADIEAVWKILVGLGVQVRPNPFSSQHYPYPAQGLVSIECVDC